MLIGEYHHLIDNKNRLSVPSKWRKTLEEKVILTKGLDGCVFLFSINEWVKIAEKFGSLSFGNKEARDLNRFLLSGAFEVEVDASGRILLPENLKTFAGLTGNVVLAGLYSRIEIWDEKTWDKKQVSVGESADTVASHLQEIGMI